MIGSTFGSGVGGLDDAVGLVCPGSLPFIYVESQMPWRCIRMVQNSSIAITNRLGMRWRRRWWAYGVGWGCSIFPNGMLDILVGIVCWGMPCLCHLGLLGECDIGVAGVSFGAVGRLGRSGLGHIGNICRRVGIQ
jgi:hypothetical protein